MTRGAARFLAAFLALGLLAAPSARAAGTVTVEEVRFGSVRMIVWTWTSTAGGIADGATTYSYDGELVMLATDPSGAAAPTDDYDLTITDSRGLDVLTGSGANRDAADTEYVRRTSLGAVAVSTLTLNISNAGAAKSGVVVLLLR